MPETLTPEAIDQAPDLTADDVFEPATMLDVEAPWPELDENAYHGLAGDIVRTIEPQTESAPVALLVQLLVMVGSAIGRTAYFPVEADRHHMNLFACMVGATSKGRKGTSAGHPKRLVGTIDPAWGARVMGGLSSGEGVIWNVRDAVYGHNKKGEEVCFDEGVDDKRLCILETEFARALGKTGQEGNVLSAVLRQAWDHGDLRTLVSGRQKAPVSATHAHVSLIAHITAEELQRLLTDTEAANGFGNRFLWVCVKRSKLLPRGGRYLEQALRPLSDTLAKVIFHARTVAEMCRTAPAEERWEDIYTALAEGHSGLLGSITARAEAQVLRLSCLYALLDKTNAVDVPHLNAAYALWQYCEDSARYIFGTMLGNPLADDIYRMLKLAGTDGMTRTDISNDLGRHHRSADIQAALLHLSREGMARPTVETTPGRPVERWFFSVRGCEKSELSEKSPPIATLNSLNSLNSHMGINVATSQTSSPAFANLTASVLWCAACQQANPVRLEDLAYLCTVCGTSAGVKTPTAPLATGADDPESDACQQCGSTQPPSHEPQATTLPSVGDLVIPLTADGSQIPDNGMPFPWLIVRIESGPDGQQYALFAESDTGWLLAQCQPAPVGHPTERDEEDA